MGQYYIQAGSTIYELDATTSISQDQKGTPTNNVVESGAALTDHYVNNPVSFSMEGVISDVKSISASSNRSTQDFIQGLTKIKNNKELFTFFFGLDVGAYENCVFTSLTISQDKKNGVARGSTSSYRIRATIQQIRLARKVRITQDRDPAFTNILSDPVEGSGSPENLSSQANQTRLEKGIEQIKRAIEGV